MSLQPAPGLRLCALDDLPDPGSKGFRWEEGGVLFAGFIVRVGAEVSGFFDVCPHQGLPLSELGDGYLTRSGAYIRCGAHGALFRRNGVCVAGPCVGEQLRPWPVVVCGDDIVTAKV